MAEAMTKEEAMTVAVNGERAQIKDLVPALKTLFSTVRTLEIESADRFTSNETLRKKLHEREAGSKWNVAMPDESMALAIIAIVQEALSAYEVHGPLLNAHHFEGVFREEYDELWDEIKLKEALRDPVRMRHEAKQAAAVLLRFMLDCCGKRENWTSPVIDLAPTAVPS